jgi:hypothetical protein
MAKNKPNENKGSKLDEKITEKILGIEQEINETIEERLIMQDQTVKSKKEALDIMKRQQSRQDKLKEAAQKWKDHWKEFKEIAKDPQIATGAFLAASADKAKDIGNSFMDMQKSAGLAYTQTANMSGVLASSVSSGWMVGVGFKASAEAAGALSDELGDIGEITSGAVKNIASMAHSYGISNSEAAKLTKAVKNISGDSTDVASNMLVTAKEMAISANVAPGKVIKDMASNTELMAGFSQDGGKNLTETAVQAAKLGISLSDVSSMLNGILDVESSIEKEMEASVLLNRQISFDKARQLAMSGDTLGATKAILEQVGGIAEWENMSIMQRKSLAEAAGVELGIMNSMINSRDKQVEMGLIEASTSEKTLKTMVGIGSTIKNNATWLASTANFSAMIFKQANLERLKQAAHWVKELAHSVKMKLFGGQSAVSTGGGLTKAGKPDMRFKANKSPVGGKAGGFMKGLNPTSMLKGAAAMVIMGAALWVAAKGFQELAKVEWGALFPGAVIALVALTAAMVGLSFIAPMVLTGALVFGAMSVALLLFGTALSVVAGALPLMVTPLTQLAEVGGTALMSIGLGFGAMGMGLVSMAGGLALITPMLPTLLAVGGLAAMGMSLLGGPAGVGEKAGGDNVVVEKLDELIGLIRQGGTINMDGKKVGDVIALAQGPLGS